MKVELITEVVNLKAGKSSSPNKKRTLKRDISQISTIIHEKELLDALEVKEKKEEKKTKKAEPKKSAKKGKK